MILVRKKNSTTLLLAQPYFKLFPHFSQKSNSSVSCAVVCQILHLVASCIFGSRKIHRVGYNFFASSFPIPLTTSSEGRNSSKVIDLCLSFFEWKLHSRSLQYSECCLTVYEDLQKLGPAMHEKVFDYVISRAAFPFSLLHYQRQDAKPLHLTHSLMY